MKKLLSLCAAICLSLSFLSAQVQLGADIDGEAAGDWSGWSVSLSADGSRLAIGARLNDGGGTDAGHVRVFQWNSSTMMWDKIGQDIDGEAAGDNSGWSVSLSADGNRLAIGARFNDDGGSNAGHVRVFQWNSSTMMWDKIGQDIDGEAAGDNSGWSVSLSADGSRLAIGGLFNDDGGSNAGHARVYQWNSATSMWDQFGQDIDGEAANDQSGYSVSLSGDGNRLAIGATRNDGGGTNAGHARVFLPLPPPPAPVPTLSEWSLIIFALLMVIGGTIAVRRRKQLLAAN